MKQYTKQIGGKTVIKTRKEIIVRKDGKQTINPSEEMLLADGWVEYVPPTAPSYEPSEEQLFRRALARKLRDLEAYDQSSSVNDCIIVHEGNELHYWADKTERDALKGALRDCLSMGRTYYRLDLRKLGISLHIPCENLLQMLSALEVYAIDCYNKTTDHEYMLRSLTNKEEVDAYDFTIGYPEKLRFEL